MHCNWGDISCPDLVSEVLFWFLLVHFHSMEVTALTCASKCDINFTHKSYTLHASFNLKLKA